jgi:imidazolonepropionase-like amidohydrolase
VGGRLSIRAAHAWLGPGSVAHDLQVDCAFGEIVAVGNPHPVEDADVLEVDGTILPAFADRHVHVGLADPAAILSGGVTAVRDLAWPGEAIFPLADLSESDGFEGPLIRAAGPMLTAPGGYPIRASWAPEGTGWEIATPEEAAEAVGSLLARGATHIKVSLNADAGPTPTDAVLLAIAETAHSAQIPVTAHAQGAGQVERALGAGLDELAHTPWTERLSDAVVRLAAARLRIVSTLDIQSHGLPTAELERALDNLRRFHAAGGEVVYGTDLGNGPIPPGIHVGELRHLEAAGLSADEVLAAAVRSSLEPGAPADVIAVAGDPLTDLGTLGRPLLVVRAGRRIEREPGLGQ